MCCKGLSTIPQSIRMFGTNTVKAKIYYQLIDKELYTIIASMEAEGNYGGTQVLLNMIEDEAYHIEIIKNDYPDTYNFICSIRDLRNTIGNYY